MSGRLSILNDDERQRYEAAIMSAQWNDEVAAEYREDMAEAEADAAESRAKASAILAEAERRHKAIADELLAAIRDGLIKPVTP